MELPLVLREAIERQLAETQLGDLQQAAGLLSQRYRAETKDGQFHLSGALAVKAYLAARMPATYAAIRASMEAVASVLPAFRPSTLLDVGAGPGSALWAASDCWADLKAAVLVEASPAAQAAGKALLENAALPDATWRSGNIVEGLPGLEPANLVTMSYVLDELPADVLPPLICRLWALTSDVLLVVEPGTPAGWRRILEVRYVLIEAGAAVIAPCAHAFACPLAEPDWCHFAQRVARSRLHRLTKHADVPWEDEKYIYLAASRLPVPVALPRVLASPRRSSGKATLKLCCTDGTCDTRLVTRRDGQAFKSARKLDWGDAVKPG